MLRCPCCVIIIRVIIISGPQSPLIDNPPPLSHIKYSPGTSVVAPFALSGLFFHLAHRASPCTEAEFMNVQFSWASGQKLDSSQNWSFRIQCLHYKPVSTHFCSGGGVVRALLCGVSQLVARRLAVRQAEFDSRLGTTGSFFPTELTSDEQMERGPGEWRRINVLCECDWINVWYKNMKNKQKDWHPVTKPLKIKSVSGGLWIASRKILETFVPITSKNSASVHCLTL
jgi:hypothetical protein